MKVRTSEGFVIDTISYVPAGRTCKTFQLGCLHCVNVCAVGVAPSLALLAQKDRATFDHFLHLAELAGAGVVGKVTHPLANVTP